MNVFTANSINTFAEVSIMETCGFYDLLAYLYLILKNGLFLWILYILIIWCFSKNRSLVIIRVGRKVVGGFVLTDFPVAKYKPYNFFNKEARLNIKNLRENGFVGLCCFLIDELHRGKGLGSKVWQDYFVAKQKTIYFTSSPGARIFYVRNGAKIFYRSTYDIYFFDGHKN